MLSLLIPVLRSPTYLILASSIAMTACGGSSGDSNDPKPTTDVTIVPDGGSDQPQFRAQFQ